MITIFDFNPTTQELIDIQFDSHSLCLKFGIETDKNLTPELYKELINQQQSFYDLALLFEFRNDSKAASKYWEKVPKEWKENFLGVDYETIPS
jgi:hypothetical protein